MNYQPIINAIITADILSSAGKFSPGLDLLGGLCGPFIAIAMIVIMVRGR